MNKTEKTKVKEAIKLLMSDEGFNDGIDILCELVGLERAVSRAMKDPSGKVVSIFGILKNEKSAQQGREKAQELRAH